MDHEINIDNKKNFFSLNIFFLKPKLRWIKAGRIVRMLVGVCIAIRKYAFEAGLLDNYLVNVSHRHKVFNNQFTFNIFINVPQ